jgi:hypothetical protein
MTNIWTSTIKKHIRSFNCGMFSLSIAKGYDAIALVTPNGYGKYMKNGTIPRSTEL